MTSAAPLHHKVHIHKGLTTAGFASIGSGLVAMAVLHATSGLNPAVDVISSLLYTPLGWLLPVSLLLFAAGAVAFGLVARASRAPRWVGSALFAWSACIVLVAAFPTDPPGTGDYSMVHFVHRYAAFIAFCIMAALGIAFARWAGTGARQVRIINASGWVAIVALAVTAGPYVLEFINVDPPDWTAAAGLNQRMTVGSELLALACLGLWLRGEPSPVRESVPASRSSERELVPAA